MVFFRQNLVSMGATPVIVQVHVGYRIHYESVIIFNPVENSNFSSMSIQNGEGQLVTYRTSVANKTCTNVMVADITFFN